MTEHMTEAMCVLGTATEPIFQTQTQLLPITESEPVDCAKAKPEMPEILNCFADGKIVRYNNKLYKLLNPYSSLKRYNFMEYYLWVIEGSECYSYEFSLDLGDKAYIHYPGNTSDEYAKLMFEHVISNIKFIEEKDCDKEYLDCLRCSYIQSITHNISKEEIATREVYHEKKVLTHLNKCATDIAKQIHNIVLERFTRARTVLHYSENSLTESNEHPILYHVPNMDGKMRQTYDEYLCYIFQKVLGSELGFGLGLDLGLGPSLVQFYAKIFPPLRFEYEESASSCIPNLIINIPIRTDNILN